MVCVFVCVCTLVGLSVSVPESACLRLGELLPSRPFSHQRTGLPTHRAAKRRSGSPSASVHICLQTQSRILLWDSHFTQIQLSPSSTLVNKKAAHADIKFHKTSDKTPWPSVLAHVSYKQTAQIYIACICSVQSQIFWFMELITLTLVRIGRTVTAPYSFLISQIKSDTLPGLVLFSSALSGQVCSL